VLKRSLVQLLLCKHEAKAKAALMFLVSAKQTFQQTNSKARYTLPVSTGRVHGPWTRLSKITRVEKAVARQLSDHLSKYNLLPRRQSTYRRHHSTETAVLRVLSDVLTAVDGRRVTLLGLLDVSAAFDCVDHDLLLQRLQKNFRLTGVVLRWLMSFLIDRT